MIVKQAQAGDVAPGITRFGFTIDHWDRAVVQEALMMRNLSPQSDTDKGFWFADPEGNEIGVFSSDWMPRPSGGGPTTTTWKALSANHIVFNSPDYKTMANWYLDLFGFYQTTDAGRDVYQWFGDSVWIPTATGEGEESSAAMGTLDHVAYTIADYETRPVGLELKRRGMIAADSNAENGTSLGINCVDVNDFKTQICAWNLVVNADRGNRPDRRRWRPGPRPWSRSRRPRITTKRVSCLASLSVGQDIFHPASDPPTCAVGPLLQKLTKKVDSETPLNYSVRKQLVLSTA